MNNALTINFRKRKRLTTLLGLALDGSQLEGVVLRRTNGSVQIQQSFSATLTLDPLTAAPELVAREIRNHLDAAGVRERVCVVALPLKWTLTAQTELPQLPPADADSLLQIEAERAFPSDLASLRVSDSRCALPEGKQHVTLAAISGAQLEILECVLAAAKLKPLSFSTALPSLQFPGDAKSNGVLALYIGEGGVGLQITASGGIAALRSLEGAIESEGSRRALHTEWISREIRITLGQLPAPIRGAIKRIRIFGPRDLARQLADEMETRFEPLGMEVEIVSAYAGPEFAVELPAQAPVSAAFSLATRFLTEQKPALEFLPPKPTAIEQLIAKYSSGKLRTAGALAAGVFFIILGIFLYQQIELTLLQSQWSKMSGKVAELDGLQQQIRQYRPWFDDSFQDLGVLRQLSLAFPEDGIVTAKSIEIRDGNTVTCAGTARDNASLLKTLNALRSGNGVNDLKVEQIRGKSPIQFTFNFHWTGGPQ